MNRVRSERTRLGMTQSDLAQRAGVSRATVSLIENDRVTPSVYVAIAIARALGQATERVFAGKGGGNVAVDRRSGSKKGVPHVGKVPRSRTKTGAWRKKRSDAGKPRKEK